MLVTLLVGAELACTLVETDRVLGVDLARADLQLSSIPDDYIAGFAPMPGVRRVFGVRELARIARQYGIKSDNLRPLCFERRIVFLSDAGMRDAVRAALPSDVRVELVDYPRSAYPAGVVEFRAADLNGTADVAGLITLRGLVRYGQGRSSPVWARVRVLREETWVEAKSSISARANIDPNSLIVKTAWRFPLPATTMRSIDAIAGKTASRAIAEGQPFTRAMLIPSKDVRPGDNIDVEVRSGPVRIRLPATALGVGRTNDSVLVKTDHEQRVQVVVVGKGKAYVDAENVVDMRASVRNRASVRQGQEATAAHSPGPIPR